MYKQQFLKTMAAAVALLATSTSYGQATVGGNNGGPTDYLGWDSGTGFPLKVMNNSNEPIEWWTDTIHRMQLWETQSSTINGFINRKQDGFLGISDVSTFFAPTAVGPFSRIHLVDAENADTTNPITFAQVLGYRPWMRNGKTMTGNNDQMYVGQLFNGLDHTDVAIVWSDKQRLRQPRYYA